MTNDLSRSRLSMALYATYAASPSPDGRGVANRPYTHWAVWVSVISSTALANSIACFETGGGPKSWAKRRSATSLAQMFIAIPTRMDAATARADRRSQGEAGSAFNWLTTAASTCGRNSGRAPRGVNRPSNCSMSSFIMAASQTKSAFSPGPSGSGWQLSLVVAQSLG